MFCPKCGSELVIISVGFNTHDEVGVEVSCKGCGYEDEKSIDISAYFGDTCSIPWCQNGIDWENKKENIKLCNYHYNIIRGE